MSYKPAGPSAMETYIPSGSEKSTGSYHEPIKEREDTPPVQPVAYNPTFTEYVNHGSQYAQAVDHSTSRGVSDVDFDDKTGTAYASLNEFQDRRIAAAKLNGGATAAAPAPHTPMGNEFASVPNPKAVDGIWRNMRCLLIVLVVLIIFTLLIGVTALGFAIYNFYSFHIDPKDGGNVPQGTSAPIMMATDPNAPTYDQLLARIVELEANLSRANQRHEGNYVEYDQRFTQLHAVVRNFSAEALAAVPDQVPLYVNCTRDVIRSCTIVASERSSPMAPSSAGCETSEIDLDFPGEQVINMYCSISNGQEVLPVTSTLNIFDGAASCACFILGLSDIPQYGFDCQLTIEKCPLIYNLTSPSLF